MKNIRTIIDFTSLPEIERNIYLQDSWCNRCEQADLGIVNPELYVEAGEKFISGKCKVCDELCVSAIIEIQEKA